MEAMRFHYGDDAVFICGYKAGCLVLNLSKKEDAKETHCSPEKEVAIEERILCHWAGLIFQRMKGIKFSM